MFGFLKAAWIKWFPPSPYMHPSPLSATTVNSGFAALMAVATGMLLPWSPLKKFKFKYWGILAA